MEQIPLGPGAEFDVIRSMLERWHDRARGIGDDAALLDLPRGERLVVSVDSAVEGRHFRREWLTPAEIGYRAVAAALSDLAAMAAQPLGVLTAITLPHGWRSDLDAIADGIGDAAQSVGAPIVGGNMSGGAELTITTTVLGAAFDPLERSGARAGELVYVTGRLGGPGTALRRFREAEPPHPDDRARIAHPVPRIREARWLADHGATAAIDISDGILADLRHLAAASRVTIDVDASCIPCTPRATVDDALESGEEYELIVTAMRSIDTAAFERRFGVRLTEIGAVRLEPTVGVNVRGARVADATGYDHFSR